MEAQVWEAQEELVVAEEEHRHQEKMLLLEKVGMAALALYLQFLEYLLLILVVEALAEDLL
jgi:hypothetical protein